MTERCTTCGTEITGRIGEHEGWTRHGCPRGPLDENENEWPCRTGPRTYTVQVASEIALRYTEWTRIADLDVDWFIVTPKDDGTLEVTLSIGDQPPAA